jgi:hypothetical protein
MPITINSDIESNYEISVCNRCQKEYYTIYYAENGCTCLSEKERAKIEKQKQNWRNMQLRSAEKSRLKRLELKGNKTSVEQKETLKTQITGPTQPKVMHRSRVKPISEKQKEFNEQLRIVKLEIVNWAVDNGQYYCQGNGSIPFLLDCSHIISVKQRKDLALEKENIQLLSRESHQIWESFDLSKMVELNCFVDNMEYNIE